MKKMTPGRGVLVLATLALSLSGVLGGCGYSLVGRASNIPTDVRAVFVAPLENRTARSQVEQILTRAIIDELVTRQRFTVVNSPAEADAEIRGAVVEFTSRPVGFAADGRANEYELSIVAQVVFQRIAAEEDTEPEVLWRNDRYQFREPYQVDPNQETYFDREDESIEDVSERFAETMVSDLLEGF